MRQWRQAQTIVYYEIYILLNNFGYFTELSGGNDTQLVVSSNTQQGYIPVRWVPPVWQGRGCACKGGVHVRGEAVHGRGHTWQGGMCGRGVCVWDWRAWQRGVHVRGSCVGGGVHVREEPVHGRGRACQGGIRAMHAPPLPCTPLPLWTESQTRVKTSFPQTSFVGGNYTLQFNTHYSHN